MSTSTQASEHDAVRKTVREGYGQIAEQEATSCCGPQVTSCCGGSQGDTGDALAERLGYDEGELAELPDGANMGLSCGNPTALAELKPGETVIDLGSGGGFDVFLAGKRVGAEGKSIGVDMTPQMLSKARRNTATYQERTGLNNVEFRLGEIEHLPVADNSVDAIISNCVINLSPDKPQVWRDMFRVLKPGGRVAVSDIATLQEIPKPLLELVAAHIGCVSGAVLIDETVKMAREAGFTDIEVTEKPGHVDAMTSFNDPFYQTVTEMLPPDAKVSDYATSVNVTARKPVSQCCC
jgi:SAM-dependent methyltransferase